MRTLAAGVSALALSLTLVSVQEEIAIGKEANARVRREVPPLRHAATASYVADLGRRLALAAEGPRYPYSFAVADYREINAFALPGGPVWINRGVLQVAANESQVAGVLAHEIAHIAERHAAASLTTAMVANWGLGLLGAVLGNSGGASAAQVAARLMANGIFLQFSREDERAADRVGLRIMQRAGWDDRGMVGLLDILQRESSTNPGAVDVFLSTHPPAADRLRVLQAQLSKRRTGRRDSARFQEIKRALQMLPPAKAMPRH